MGGAIRVVRGRGLQDRRRRYRVLLNAAEAGRIRAGGDLVLRVAAGVHRVQVRIDWTGSEELEVTVPEDGTVVLHAVPGRGSPVRRMLSTSGYLALLPEAVYAADLGDGRNRFVAGWPQVSLVLATAAIGSGAGLSVYGHWRSALIILVAVAAILLLTGWGRSPRR